VQETSFDDPDASQDLPEEEQLWLFPDIREEEPPPSPRRKVCALTRALSRRYPDKRVSVVYTKNRTVILSLKPQPDGSLAMRAHECFRKAPTEVANAVVRLYLGRPTRGLKRRFATIIQSWHQKNAQPARSPTAGELVHGAVHHLPTILDIGNRSYFDGELDLDITYSTRIAKRVMGRHEHREPRSLIIINPLLDNPLVKSWYLHYLVFHECLHEVIPPRRSGDRLLLHPPEFRRQEDMHPNIVPARKYEAFLTGRAHTRLLRDYRKKRSQARSRTTAAPQAARRHRRKSTGRESSGGGSP
jgi:hypothetical protein